MATKEETKPKIMNTMENQLITLALLYATISIVAFMFGVVVSYHMPRKQPNDVILIAIISAFWPISAIICIAMSIFEGIKNQTKKL